MLGGIGSIRSLCRGCSRLDAWLVVAGVVGVYLNVERDIPLFVNPGKHGAFQTNNPFFSWFFEDGDLSVHFTSRLSWKCLPDMSTPHEYCIWPCAWSALGWFMTKRLTGELRVQMDKVPIEL